MDPHSVDLASLRFPYGIAMVYQHCLSVTRMGSSNFEMFKTFLASSRLAFPRFVPVRHSFTGLEAGDYAVGQQRNEARV